MSVNAFKASFNLVADGDQHSFTLQFSPSSHFALRDQCGLLFCLGSLKLRIKNML